MELAILDFIQGLRTPALDSVMPIVTSLADYFILWNILAVLCMIFPKTRKLGILMLLTLVLDYILGNLVLKNIVARTRPCDVNTAVQLLLARPMDYSFPSAHSMSSFSIAMVMFLSGWRKGAFAAAVIASIIAFSRMYLYVHYPTDVLAGGILGLFCGWLAVKLYGHLRRDI